MSGVGDRDVRDAAGAIYFTMRAAASGAPSCETRSRSKPRDVRVREDQRRAVHERSARDAQ